MTGRKHVGPSQSQTRRSHGPELPEDACASIRKQTKSGGPQLVQSLQEASAGVHAQSDHVDRNASGVYEHSIATAQNAT